MWNVTAVNDTRLRTLIGPFPFPFPFPFPVPCFSSCPRNSSINKGGMLLYEGLETWIWRNGMAGNTLQTHTSKKFV